MSKRTKFLLSAVLISVLPLIFGYFGLHHHVVVLLTLALIVLAAYWSQEFDLKHHEYFIFPIPLLLVVVNVFLISEVTNYSELKVWTWILLLGEVIVFYVTLLTLNILNAATVRTVPLKRAALSTLYFLSLVLTFLFSYVLLSPKLLFTNYSLLITLPFWVFVVAVPFLYYATEKPRVLESAVLALIVGELAAASMFWPSESLMRVVFVTGSAFVMLGVLQHSLNRDLSRRLRREYLLIGAILVLAFVLG